MPSTYAHYRFGTALLPAMPGDVRRTIQRFRRLFDMGLHGPDIFYYYSPLIKSGASFLGIKYHEVTGQDFFQRVCRTVRLEKSEAAQAYLYGVLCHYCLDTCMHPYVREQAALCGVSHARIETEFDRFLLETDGKLPPNPRHLTPHMRLTPGECETVAKFYPPASSRNVEQAIKNMAFFTGLLCTPEGAKRTVLTKGIDLVAPEFRGMVMTSGTDPQCSHLDEPMMEAYNRAAEDFPEMLSQLQAHMTYSAPFGAEFEGIFG